MLKPKVKIVGKLCYEVEEGYRAYIEEKNGRTLCTSQVVAVRNRTENGIEIETMNTIYELQFNKDGLRLAI